MNPSINVIKGLGILSVVAGHIYIGLPSDLLYTFHMPLFFFLSGYLFRTQPATPYLLKKSTFLLLPYASYLLLLSFPLFSQVIVALLTGEMTGELGEYLWRCAKLLYGGSVLTNEFGVFWFVTCLFLTQQIYNFLAKTSGNWIHALVIGGYALAVTDSMVGSSTHYPFAANVCLGALVFFHAGNLFGKVPPPSNRGLWLAGIITVGGISMLLLGVPVNVDMKHANYGVPLVSPIVAIAMIVCIFGAGHRIAETSLAGPIAFLGQASMTIMFLHQWFNLIGTESMGIDSRAAKFVICMVVPSALHLLIMQSALLGFLFLGKKSTVMAVFSKGCRRVPSSHCR